MLKNFFYYSFFSGTSVFISTVLSYILIEYLKFNYNLIFVITFIFFGFVNYFFNSKLNFKKELSLKKFIHYLSNITFTFVFVLFIVNLIDFFFNDISNLFIVLFFAGISSLLNFSLNYFFVFKKN